MIRTSILGASMNPRKLLSWLPLVLFKLEDFNTVEMTSIEMKRLKARNRLRNRLSQKGREIAIVVSSYSRDRDKSVRSPRTFWPPLGLLTRIKLNFEQS